MAAARPTQGDITTMIEIVGGTITAAQAEFLLRKYVSLDAAMDEYFKDPGTALLDAQPVNNNTWGPMDNTPGFRIEGEDTRDSSIRGAVSRPNSRVSNVRETYDMTNEHATTAANNTLSQKEREELADPDLQRALALSRGEDITAQESGVTGAGQQFGPATEAYYDTDKWALTTTRATTREVIEHPPPSKRRRTGDHPVFLRGSESTGYLGPLLTIYHSIPLAREAFLLPSLKVLSYGHDPNWWSGTSDENTKAVSVETSAEISPDVNNFLCEIQSLMAFLDGTHRAYGSVDALADLRLFQSFPSESQFSKLLEVWKSAATKHGPDQPKTEIFTSVALKDMYHLGESPAMKVFNCLEPPVGDYDGMSLYELMDNAVWDDNLDTPLDDVWIQHCAEIFTMRLHRLSRDGVGVGIKIPAFWWPDRYLEECRTKSWEMRLQKQKYSQEIRHLTTLQEYLLCMPNQDRNPTIDIRQTLVAAAEAVRTAAKEKSLPNGMYGDMEPLLASEEGVSKVQADECETDLHHMIDRINRKLHLLEERKDKARDALSTLTQQLTKRSASSAENGPQHRYVLQGVSTKPHITYVRIPEPEDLIEIEGDNDNEMLIRQSQEPKGQWWRMSFSREDAQGQVVENGLVAGPATQAEAMASGGNHISEWSRKVQIAQSAGTYGYSVRKVREYEVLKAAREENDSVVLVYANENAMNFKGSEPSAALKNFVQADNRAFLRELEREKAERTAVEEKNEDPFVDVPMNGEGDADLGFGTPPLTPPDSAQTSPEKSRKGASSDETRGTNSSEDLPPSYEEY